MIWKQLKNIAFISSGFPINLAKPSLDKLKPTTLSLSAPFCAGLSKNDYQTLAPEKIDLPKAESRSLKFLDASQLERLLSQPDISKLQGLRNKAILEILFSTGLRVSELVKLNRDSINLERREFGVLGKGERSRVVFLSERVVSWIRKYLDSRNYLWEPLFVRLAGAIDPTISGEKCV